MIDISDVGEIKAKVTVSYDGSGVEAAKRDLSSLADIVGGSLAESVGGANDALSSLDEQMGKSAESTGTLTTALAPLPKTLQTTGESVTAVSEVLGEHQAAIEDASTAYESIQRPIEDTTALLESVAPPMLSITQHAEAMQEQLSPVNDGFVQISESLAQSVPLLPQFAESLHTVSAQLDPRELGLDTATENLAVFQDALANPYPTQLIRQYLSETGQTWADFSSSIGDNNAAFLDQMDAMPVVSEKAFSSVSSGVAYMGQSFYTAAGDIAGFSQPWSELIDSVSGINKSGGVGAALYGPSDAWSSLNNALASTDESVSKLSGSGGIFDRIFQPSEFEKSIGDVLGNALGGEATLPNFGDIISGFDSIMRPIMYAQMFAQLIGNVSSGIYNMAALAEGPAAHSVGSFTGAVDALGVHAQTMGEQLSESFGQGIKPMLDAMNNTASSSGGGNDFLNTFMSGAGVTLGLLGDVGQILGGGIVGGLSRIITLNGAWGGSFYQSGDSWVQSGWHGLQNLWADITGAPEPFPTPSVPGGLAGVDMGAVQSSIAQSIAMMNAQASSPGYLAAQAYLQSQGAYAAQGQAAYNYSHITGSTPFDYAPQSYQNSMMAAALANGTYVGTGISEAAFNSAYFQSMAAKLPPLSPFLQDELSGGCFPAGTRILLADGTEKAIETLQIGERVLAHDGTKQVVTTIQSVIKPLPRQVYELLFADGNTLTLTNSHPVFTDQGWKSLSPINTKRENPDLVVLPLQIGDRIHTIDDACALVAIKPHAVVQIYNIAVGDPHTFYAERVLVHNKILTSQIMQNVADSNVPEMDMKNTNLIQSMMGNFTSADLTHTFTATVNWLATGDLNHSFIGNASWSAVGELIHTFIGNAGWSAVGELAHTFEGAASWVAQGGLQHTFEGAASWIASGGLQHTFEGLANWVGQGLTNLFTGKADWNGENLMHTFTGVASWDLQQITQVVGTIPGFASGVEGFQGGLAVVGEHGPELAYLPGGTSIYPQSTGGGFQPLNLGIGDGGMISVTFNHTSTLNGKVVAQESIPFIAPILRSVRGVRQ